MFLAIMAFVIVSLLTGGIAFGAVVITKSMNATVTIVEDQEDSFEFYRDAAATQSVSTIVLPDVAPGETTDFTLYVKNTGTSNLLVSQGATNVQASRGSLTLTFDGQAQKTLAPNQVARVDVILSVPENAPEGRVEFIFSVNGAVSGTANPTTTPTTNPTTTPNTNPTPVPTQTALNGQQIFATYCLSCHGSVPGTSRTQAQLVGFISGHNSGNSLTSAQVNALASFIKP
jgi:archaellum component FlaG (FlaF/FlaG flagellin family)